MRRPTLNSWPTNCRSAKGRSTATSRPRKNCFLAAVDYAMRRLHAQVVAYTQQATDPLDKVRQGVRGYLSFFARASGVRGVVDPGTGDVQGPATARSISSVRKEHSAQWREVYAELIAAGQIREMPTQRISNVISDLLYGAMFTNYFAEQPRSFEDQANDILDVVFHGILNDSKRQNRTGNEKKPQVTRGSIGAILMNIVRSVCVDNAGVPGSTRV